MPCRKSLCWLLGIFLMVSLVTVFWPVTQHGFVVWDDDLHVYDNPRFYPVTWAQVAAFWQQPYERLYVPLTYTAWAALVWLSRLLHPGPLTAELFHWWNLLLHLGSVYVVYRLFCLLLAPHAQTDAMVLPAAAGALLFGLHPLQVEAVAWVSGLKDVQAGWWAVVAMWQYVLYVQAPPGWRRRSHYGGATLAFGLALLSKPAAVVVPGMVGLLAIGVLKQPWSQSLKALGGWGLAAIVWCVWTKEQQPDVALGYVTPWAGRPLVALDTVAFYLSKLVWPVALGPDYGRTPQLVLTRAWSAYTWVVPGVCAAMVWWKRHQWPVLAVAAGMFLVALLPVSGLVSFMFQAYSTVADRYVYLALLGPALGLAWGLYALPQRQALWVVSLAVFSLLGWRSAAQVRIWQNTTTLFTHALRVNPQSAVAYHNLGWSLAQQGRVDAAVAYYRQALRLKPTMLEAHYNLGDALMAQGQLDEAIAHYLRVLDAKPTWAEVHNNLGSAWLRQGQIDKAMAHYSRALELKPGWALPANNLGDVMTRQGQLDTAAAWFFQATQAKPELPEAAYNLGGVLWLQGQHAGAVAAYREALRRRPTWPQAMTHLAWLLVTQESPPVQEVSEAVALATQACQASGFRQSIALRTLAVAYAVAGQPEAATKTAQQALTAAQASNDTRLITQITEELSQFRLVTPRTQSSEE